MHHDFATNVAASNNKNGNNNIGASDPETLLAGSQKREAVICLLPPRLFPPLMALPVARELWPCGQTVLTASGFGAFELRLQIGKHLHDFSTYSSAFKSTPRETLFFLLCQLLASSNRSQP